MGERATEYLRPDGLAGALELLSEEGSLPIASATDLAVRVKQGLERPRRLVDVSALPELRGRGPMETGYAIGAGETLDAVARDPEIARLFPALAQAARAVASPQIRNVATVGGNLCQGVRCWYLNQSLSWQAGRPACHERGGNCCYVSPRSSCCRALHLSDLAPALLVLGATVALAAEAGERSLPIAELYTGEAGRPLSLSRGELLLGLRLPVPAAGASSAYRKIRRSPIDFAVLGVACHVAGRDGQCLQATAAVIGLAAAPDPLPLVAERLVGQEWRPDRVAAVADEAVQVLSFLPHMGVPGSYRRAIAGRVVAKTLVAAWDGAGRGEREVEV